MKIRKLAITLALILVLQLLFSNGIYAENEEIPTIFINNEAWYKTSLLPLIIKEGEALVPISVFSEFDNITVSYNRNYECYLIEAEGGNFISISVPTGRYLDSNENRGSITVITEENDIYISAVTASDILGIKTEMAVFYNNDVIRFYDKEDRQPLEILIDYYITSASSYIGSAGIGGMAIRRETFSFFADLAKMKNAEARALLNAAKEQGVSMTFAIPAGFAAGRKNQALLFEISAAGHSLAVSIDESSANTPLEQAKQCNNELYRLLKKRTMLVLTTSGKSNFKDSGYTLLNDSFRINGIMGAQNINFTINDMIFFDKVTNENISKFNDIISRAKENGITVTALNALAGN